MFLRALIAFLALPGVMAFVIPAALLWSAGQTRIVYPLGLMLMAVGLAGLLWCVRDFYVQGQGTLAPWSPPQKLVAVGLYRFSRNPMYVSVTLIILGWAISFASPGVCVYTLCLAVAFQLRIVLGEEPWLARKYGIEWQNYASQVPRWFW
jgi:protein-S-isoprenylcysteine O-methyltransferase Ste14